ncbi:MAG TPA: thiamine pyrophosphate-requiring protein [Acidimicrobiia bacterium]|nr:thiamine pyrophosphate-requiring protein [Acidimicrobiia bacterium]
MASTATGAQLFLQSLQDRGVRYIFMNPGTDTFPVQEAYAKLAAAGEQLPELVMCPFESLASSAAQGMYLALGRAQVAFVHVDVGTANAAGSLNDAKANRTPVVLCAGRSPVSIEPVPGGRSKFINWLQDVPDQAMLVRNYVKNEQIAYRAAAIPHAIQRAFQVAESDPAGPTYLTLPREALMEETNLAGDVVASRYPPVRAGSPNQEDVDRVADWILEANRPVVLTGYMGRDPGAVDALVELSETAGVGVVEYRGRVNFPLTHPHHLGFRPEAATEKADLILVVEHDVPYVPVLNEPSAATRLVHIGHDPFFETIQTWGFPSDLGIRADARRTLAALQAAVAHRLDQDSRSRIELRSDAFRKEHDAWSQIAWSQIASPPGQPATPTLIGQILSDELPPNVAVFEEAVTSGNPIALQLKDLTPGRLFRNGGSFLGWGLGAATGFGLARTGDIPIALCGDGSFLFAVPSAVLWFASTHQVPLLVIVANNSTYNSVRLAGRDGYPGGAQVRHGFVATDFGRGPAAHELARACGVAGYRAADGEEFRGALKQALNTVQSGEPALVTVDTAMAEQPL